MTTDYGNLELKKLNYESYLKIPDLLDLQKQVSKPPHHDEMFFIIIHQASELWFKLLLHESNLLVSAFRAGDFSKALKILKRMTAGMQLLADQIKLLSTLTPVEFAGFRDLLRPASGFQSVQFREMEFRFGMREPFFLNFFKSMPQVVSKLEKISTEPSVYDECLRALAKLGYAIPKETLERDLAKSHESNEALAIVIKEIYEKPGDHYDLVLLFEAMLDFDQALTLWRYNHVTVVTRAIGRKKGTGGSAGVDFLLSRTHLHCFPELWEARNHIGGGY